MANHKKKGAIRPLEKCPSCKKRIAPSAPNCPKCGHVLELGWAESATTKRQIQEGVTGMGCLVVIVVLGVLIFSGSTKKIEQTVTVKASEYGKDWGFTISNFELTCRVHDYGAAAGRYRKRPHVIIVVDGVKYALNGAAMGSGLYRNAREIMKRDEFGTFSARSIDQVLQRGLAMCR